MSDTTPAKPRPGCHFAAILLVWVPGTLIFDALFGYGAFMQCRTWGFAEVPGEVVSSELVTTRTNEGHEAYQLGVTYRYMADGREFRGDRYRYGGFSTADPHQSAEFGKGDQSWHRIAGQFPPGNAVVVYHDPANPTEATLTRGPQGFDLWLGNFLVPFNLVAVGMVASRLRRRRAGEGPHGTVVVSKHGLFAGVWGFVAVVSTFVLVLTAGFNPPMWAAAIPWAVGPGLGLAAFMAVAWAERKADRHSSR